MIVVMRTGADWSAVEEVKKTIEAHGLEAYVMVGEERSVIGVVGQGVERVAHVASMPGVEQVVRVSKPYKLASSEHHRDRTRVRVGTDVVIGAGSPLVVMAGPCAVESRDQLAATARWVKREGATMLRGGAYKPRSSPYTFQGLEIEGLKLLADVREEVGLPIVTEVTNPADVPVFEDFVDMLQVGARNMQNFVLLKAVGRSRLPVLLKRGLSATIEELLMAAEYILAAGNPNVVLCERGVRSFDPATRNILDLAAVPVLRERTHLPVIVDPSHATGHRPLVRPMAVAGAAAGADGMIIEVHPNPPQALSDSEQSLSFPEFGDLMDDLRRFEYLRRPAAATTPASTAIVPGDLERLRGRIDDVDARIAALIEERAQLAVAVQQTRKESDHGHDVGRERELLERAVAGSEDSVLLPQEREQVYSAIIRAARSAQRRQAAAAAASTAGAIDGAADAETLAGSVA
jgi:3-deoxy-7-phosphoheptulonate synthase